jgi:hypothetical protein
MSSQIDFRALPENVPKLCIPRVYPNISESRIRKIFDDLNIGIIERIDIIRKKHEISDHLDKREKFNRVIIHFRYWNNTNNANIARERLLNGKEIKIIYDDPWFWKISAYREMNVNKFTNIICKRKAILQLDSDEDNHDIKSRSGEKERLKATVNNKNIPTRQRIHSHVSEDEISEDEVFNKSCMY